MADFSGKDDSLLFGLTNAQISRRNLLKAAGLLGVAAAAGPALAACGSSSSSSASPSASAAASPVKGGRLRIGVIGGSARDVTDLQVAMTSPDNLRGRQLFNTLFEYDHTFKMRPALATEATSNATGDVWTVKLRPGVTFHNGKPLTAGDVVWTFQNILDPKFTNVAVDSFKDVDPKGLKAIDDLTVEFALKRPNGDFLNSLAFIHATIKPEGFDP
ncbi:MAG TPA: ABC transporter substrate-binding protein, partial [Candidatus Limnocylindrales bacterium]